MLQIGLGDITPEVQVYNSGTEKMEVAGGLFFWFLYVQFGLAIVAIVISMIREKVTSIALRAKAAALRHAALLRKTSKKEKGPATVQVSPKQKADSRRVVILPPVSAEDEDTSDEESY